MAQTVKNLPAMYLGSLPGLGRSPRKMTSLSCVRLFVTPWTAAHQAPPSMEFSRQEYWSGLPFSSPGDLPDPGIENPGLLHCRQMLYCLSHQGSPRSLLNLSCIFLILVSRLFICNSNLFSRFLIIFTIIILNS